MKLDIHSFIHCLGCYALTLTFYSFSIPYCFFWAFVLGVIWELFDQINYWFELDIPFLDLRGADNMDIIMDGLGVVLAAGVLFFV